MPLALLVAQPYPSRAGHSTTNKRRRRCIAAVENTPLDNRATVVDVINVVEAREGFAAVRCSSATSAMAATFSLEKLNECSRGGRAEEKQKNVAACPQPEAELWLRNFR